MASNSIGRPRKKEKNPTTLCLYMASLIRNRSRKKWSPHTIGGEDLHVLVFWSLDIINDTQTSNCILASRYVRVTCPPIRK